MVGVGGSYQYYKLSKISQVTRHTNLIGACCSVSGECVNRLQFANMLAITTCKAKSIYEWL